MGLMTVKCTARLTPVLVDAVRRDADRLRALSDRALDEALREMMVCFAEIEGGSIVVRVGLRERFFDRVVPE